MPPPPWYLALLALAACATPPDPPSAAASDPQPPAPAPIAAPSPPAPAVQRTAPAHPAARPLPYPWLTDRSAPTVEGTLEARFPAPSGFARVPLPARSFGAWLRALPLAPPGTPVRSYLGRVVLPADHPNLAAVVAIDVGDADLQQCADSVIRLHAEWLYAQGRRDQSYRAASGAAMPFARWARGERMVPDGRGLAWKASARADGGRAAFRRWLDGVFAFANTGSLARDTERVAPDDLRPGDFVVQPGSPGHAVLVLDVARAGDRRALLLGQGFMPAQSFQVLRPAEGSAWFVVEPGATGLDTPFWPAFPWKALRRFPGT